MDFRASQTNAPESPTVPIVLANLCRHPVRNILLRWNWKAALLSSLLRASIFFFVNLVAGWHAAIGAMSVELGLRLITSGFYGAITESLGAAQPAWVATSAAMILLPCMNHSLEFVVHWIHGTPKLALSIVTSMIFTAVSTAFNLYAMQRGVLTVGEGSRSLGHDLCRIPGLLCGFVTALPRALISRLNRDGALP